MSKRAESKKIPHYSHTFLYRQGLRMLPSQNFLDKFKEEYDALLSRFKKKEMHIDDETAIFFIISFFEAIIYCIDFGFDVFFWHLIVFKSKISDYKNNTGKARHAINENIKKITFKLYSYCHLKMKDNVNKDNEKYQEYLKQKKERYQAVKDYYKEFYNKQDEWW